MKGLRTLKKRLWESVVVTKPKGLLSDRETAEVIAIMRAAARAGLLPSMEYSPNRPGLFPRSRDMLGSVVRVWPKVGRDFEALARKLRAVLPDKYKVYVGVRL